jgi:hypothetical protein
MLPLPYLPRIFGRQDNRNNVPARTPEEYYKRTVFLPFLDGILTQMSLRFCNREAAVLRLCGLLPKFALKKALIIMPHCYAMLRRGNTSSSNFSSDVIKTWSAETTAKTKTDMSETKTAKKRSRQVSRPASLNFRRGRYFAMQWTIRHLIV